MNIKDDSKKLGIILSSVVIIILIILVFYIVTTLFSIDKNKPGHTLTTTKPIDTDYKELMKNEKVNYNLRLNNVALLKGFHNAVLGDYEIKNTNLIESEEAKFRFIYAYLFYNQPTATLKADDIHYYSTMFFNASLDVNNLIKYAEQNTYKYDILYPDVNYCLKVNKEKNFTLLIDMLAFDEINCDINVIDYDQSLVLKKLTITYEIINNNYIYKSFIIV